MTEVQSPIDQSQRIVSIDVLRGFALLGILMMNIQSFGLIEAKYGNPVAQGDLSSTSYACWLFAHVLFDLKFMTLFSILFGAGIVLMWQRAQAVGHKVTGLHYRRMLWLLLIGLAHAHLLWFGDILVHYALCGMIVYWLCGLQPRWLFPIGFLLLVITSTLFIGLGYLLPHIGEEGLAELQNAWQPTTASAEESYSHYRSGWLDQMPHRSSAAIQIESFMFLIYLFWRCSGLMLIGMALFKLDFFSAERSAKFYWLGAAIGYLIGLSIVIFGVYQNEAHNWNLQYSMFFGGVFNFWGSILVAIGHGCLVMLACKFGWLTWLQKRLADVGRMALTNYLMQTIICTTLFYGHGFGWYGHFDRPMLILIVLVIWLFQLVASPVWLKHFRFGPFEWLWRSLSYWKLQPMRAN